MNCDLISVCVTTYNRKNKLKRTINSILNQTYSNFELLIVDDFSTDGTQILVEKTIINLDTRIRYIRHSYNLGLANARNTAIQNANGQYFTFCDDDDEWSNTFLNTFLYHSKKYKEDFSFCASLISKDLTIKSVSSSFKSFILRGYTPPVASQFYPTHILKKLGGYNTSITSGVDHDLWLTLAHNNFNLIWINQELVKINKEITPERMTWNFEKRLEGINKSLEIWHSRIKNDFGASFFNLMAKNYRYNTHKKQLLFSFQQKNFKNILVCLIKMPKFLFLQDVKRYLRKNKIDNVLIHPTFTKCFNPKEQFVEKLKILR